MAVTNDVEQTEKPISVEEDGKKGPYPKSVIFIISNEFCERFSYYGMRTILTIYLTSQLAYSDNDATSLFHIFAMACYFTPVLGAIIADSWLGKFKTIFYISIIYVLGSMVLSAGAFKFELSVQRTLSIVGLALIALGTGGIKPCVAAFGGDQFVKGQEVYLQQFFSFFYICINAGSTLSTFLTPILRQVKCYGEQSCFSLAFGVPAVLMITSLVLFLLGRPYYRMVPPGENVLVKMGGCIGCAVKNKFFGDNGAKQHWLDNADHKYDQKFIEEVKSVLRVLFLYIPVPIFWALFDQQGSTWTIQATRMQWSIFGITVLPDQVQLLNPMFILILAPLCTYYIYPALNKCGLLRKPLQKMIVGGVLAAAAFIVCMFVQFAIDAQDANAITFSNTLPCNIKASYSVDDKSFQTTLNSSYGWMKVNRPFPRRILFEAECTEIKNFTYEVPTSHKDSREKLIADNNSTWSVVNIPELNRGDKADVKVLFNGEPFRVNLQNSQDSTQSYEFELIPDGPHNLSRLALDPVDGVSYRLHEADLDCPKPETFLKGEGYLYTITTEKKCSLTRTLASPTLSVLWQTPQYFLITAGEVMFSVTGLEFSYSQAPKNMKSVLQAGWLMTVALGNLLVVIIEMMGIEQQSMAFLVFGIMMLVDMFLFSIFAWFYVPVAQSPEESEKTADEMCDIQKEDTSLGLQA